MRNKNIWIGIGLVAAIALVAVLAMVLPTRIASPYALLTYYNCIFF